MSTEDTTQDVEHERSMLLGRARSLRAQAGSLPDVLAATYRRRAAELELQAWAVLAHSSDELALSA